MNCLGCGAVLPERRDGARGRERKYCSNKCYPTIKPRQDRPTTCAYCSKPIEQLRAAGNPRRTCNRTCRDALAVEKRKAQATFTATCHYCKSEFLTTNKKQKYCQTSCRLDYQRNLNAEKTRLYYKTLYPDGLKHKICDWCNEELIVPAQKTLASRRYHEDCSVEAQRARYRIKTVKRQSKTTKPSRLAADQVLREYGSKCHICKEEIDLSLPRTSRMGLTVDHLMPLSKGGSDELDNLRPAHWICNNRKSDKIDAESW